MTSSFVPFSLDTSNGWRKRKAYKSNTPVRTRGARSCARIGRRKHKPWQLHILGIMVWTKVMLSFKAFQPADRKNSFNTHRLRDVTVIHLLLDTEVGLLFFWGIKVGVRFWKMKDITCLRLLKMLLRVSTVFLRSSKIWSIVFWIFSLSIRVSQKFWEILIR